MSQNSPRTDADLKWQAFLYAAGELPAAEACAFEALLAHEVAAQEALVQAMQLSSTVTAALQVAPVLRDKSECEAAFTNKWPMVWGSLLSVALLILTYSLSNPFATVASTQQAELAELWSTQLAVTDTVTALAESESSLGLEEPALEHASGELVASEEAYPAWMLEAVRASQSNELPNDTTVEEMES